MMFWQRAALIGLFLCIPSVAWSIAVGLDGPLGWYLPSSIPLLVAWVVFLLTMFAWLAAYKLRKPQGAWSLLVLALGVVTFIIKFYDSLAMEHVWLLTGALLFAGCTGVTMLIWKLSRQGEIPRYRFLGVMILAYLVIVGFSRSPASNFRFYSDLFVCLTTIILTVYTFVPRQLPYRARRFVRLSAIGGLVCITAIICLPLASWMKFILYLCGLLGAAISIGLAWSTPSRQLSDR